jgi:phosphoribosylformylglycinamidine synthase
MDGLCFGDAEDPKTRRLSHGIVGGIGGYGNAVGVATVGGKTLYDPCYADNPLVNAMNLGLVELDKMVSSQTARSGNTVLLLGSKTGRDGIAGAAFASAELNEDTESSKPQIQIGDPFEEKLLIEACLDLLDARLIVSMQDMGAAGIISSSSEIAAKSKVGMVLDIEKVPLREEAMEPWEILLSESQERMLLIAEPEEVPEILRRSEKWELDCTVIGTVTEGDRWEVRKNGETVVDLPASLIVEGTPTSDWPLSRPTDLEKRWAFDVEAMDVPADWRGTLLDLAGSANIGEKRWIHESYDTMVRLNTVVGPGSPVSVIRCKGNGCLLGMTMETDPWKTYLDPFRGGAETVARGLRPLWVSGARALGMTDCLNFASPEIPEQYWELEQAILGMSEIAEKLHCPVVSGNVSLYNETASTRIYPTPLVGIVGLYENQTDLLNSGCWAEGDHIFLVGPMNAALDGSQYQIRRTGDISGRPLPVLPAMEGDFRDRALKTSSGGLARSGRALAGGGLAIALVKEACCAQTGAVISFDVPTRKDVLLFGEGGPRALYAVPSEKVLLFRKVWGGYPMMEIGRVGGQFLRVEGVFDVALKDLDAELER